MTDESPPEPTPPQGDGAPPPEAGGDGKMPVPVLETPQPCGCVAVRFSDGQDRTRMCVVHALMLASQSAGNLSIGLRMAADRLGEMHNAAMAQAQAAALRRGNGPPPGLRRV